MNKKKVMNREGISKPVLIIVGAIILIVIIISIFFLTRPKAEVERAPDLSYFLQPIEGPVEQREANTTVEPIVLEEPLPGDEIS